MIMFSSPNLKHFLISTSSNFIFFYPKKYFCIGIEKRETFTSQITGKDDQCLNKTIYQYGIGYFSNNFLY